LDAGAVRLEAGISGAEGNPLDLSRSLVDRPRGFSSRVALGVEFTAPPFADDHATYLGLAAPVTFFQRVFQTRFLPFRFRDLRLTFLRETASM
jgi:hypothetical protein